MKTTLITTLTLLSTLMSIASAHAEPSPIKIGFNVSLTGDLAEFGTAIQNGVSLAMEEHPELAELVSPIFEDSQYQSTLAVTNFEKLRLIDKVDAIYLFGGPMTDTLAPLAERHGVPLFSTEYDTRYTQGREYVVRFANNASDYAQAVLNTLRTQKRKKFAIVKMENQYHNTLSSAFIDSIGSNESAIVVHNFLPGETDFRSVFPALRRGDFDAVGVYILPGSHNAFFAQARNAGVDFAGLFGTDSFESPTTNANIETTVEGALFANSFVQDSFRTRYLERFGNTAQLVHAALAYEFVVLVKDTFSNSKRPTSAKEFLSAMQPSSSRKSVCGEYFFRNTTETGKYFSFPLAVREVHNGTPRIIATYEAP